MHPLNNQTWLYLTLDTSLQLTYLRTFPGFIMLHAKPTGRVLPVLRDEYYRCLLLTLIMTNPSWNESRSYLSCEHCVDGFLRCGET
jgi:hypothetical protein